MRILLDTHALLWWLFDDPRLPERARQVIRSADNVVHVSSASAWEIATKHRLGKLPEGGDIVGQLPRLVQAAHFTELPISIEHALHAGQLAIAYRDPFDRMLAAQAHTGDLPLVTRDEVFRDLGVPIVWE